MRVHEEVLPEVLLSAQLGYGGQVGRVIHQVTMTL